MIWISSFFLVVCLSGLILSGELLVVGALRLSRVLQVSPLIVGLTVVAFGTSAPELFVAVQAVQNAAEGVALGNIVGSNIANVLLVLGVPAFLVTIKAAQSETVRDTVIMLIATSLFCVIAYGTGGISFRAGIGLVGCILVYLIYTAIRSLNTGDSRGDSYDVPVANGGALAVIVFLIFSGLVGLAVSSHYLIFFSVKIASHLGVSDELIGLSVIALGTSLPELGTVFSAARKGAYDVAIGGIIGSNLFNLLAVGGAVGLSGGAGFSSELLGISLPIMTVTSLLIGVIILKGWRLGRFVGAVFVIAYCGYILFLAQAGGLF